MRIRTVSVFGVAVIVLPMLLSCTNHSTEPEDLEQTCTEELDSLCWTSDDWGETWHFSVPVIDGIIYETPIHALALDPHIPGRTWAGIDGGVIQTDNRIATWDDASWEYVPLAAGRVWGLAVLSEALFAATAQNQRGGAVYS